MTQASFTIKRIVPHTIYWFPAHVGSVKCIALKPSKSEPTAARALSDCADLDLGYGSSADDTGHIDTPTTHNEITKCYYMVRLDFPVPYSKLNGAQASLVPLTSNPFVPAVSIPKLISTNSPTSPADRPLH